ncbi:MAG: biopolymer transporter ExbD [Vicinamibacterales bacterium]
MPKLHLAESGASVGGRRGRGPRVASSLSEINVVPLVDVMLVLLIIFMVAAPMMQRGMDVNLPVAQRSAAITSERVFVTLPATFASDRYVQLDDERIRVDVLAERIRQLMLTNEQKSVYLRGDGGVTLQQLIDVMDRLREGGVERVGIVARLPGER